VYNELTSFIVEAKQRRDTAKKTVSHLIKTKQYEKNDTES
jgi:hypothetical protein